MRAYPSVTAAALAAMGCGPAPLQPRDPTPGVPHFVVETYNVNDTGNGDLVTLEAIGAANADVVCLQEITDVWQQVITARYADVYPNMLFYALTGSEGLGVLSKFPLEDLGFHHEVHGWHPAWHIQVDMPMGPVQMLNTHLRSLFRGESNALSSYLATSDDHLEEIQGFSALCTPGLPTLVLGDFNESPDGEAIGFMEAAPRSFQNVLPLYHPGQPTWHAPPAWQMEQTIDHILFNGQFASLSSWVLDAGNSDHLPVLAHFEEAPP